MRTMTESGCCFSPRRAAAETKMPAASNWWLPSSTIKPPPVRSQSRQRINSSIGRPLVVFRVELAALELGLGFVAELLGRLDP